MSWEAVGVLLSTSKYLKPSKARNAPFRLHLIAYFLKGYEKGAVYTTTFSSPLIAPHYVQASSGCLRHRKL